MIELTPEQRDSLECAGISAIANALLGLGFRNVWMRHIAPVRWHGGRNMVGPAFTLRFIPAREDIDTLENYARADNVHRCAMEKCPPGSVLVISANGEIEAASAGDLMIARLKARGVAGIVTDGGFRDTPDIAAISFPAYQRAPATPASPLRLHPVELDVPVGCGGVPVYPGDIIVGDAAGVVVIPAAHVAAVAETVAETTAYEEFAMDQIERGRSIFEVFPATAQSRIEYAAWQAARSTS
ncbi:MAG: hypothetical protein ABIQ66_08470 [Novosphingobium sp.]